jgi:hypothetical protein
VTREDFRRELGDAMDSISGSPDPALSDRVRAALVEAPERRGPVWIAALAAAVIAVILVGVLLVGNPLNRPLGSAGNHSPNPTPGAVVTPTSIATASPEATPFICSQSSAHIAAQSLPPQPLIDAVRTGAHADLGYDRLTIEFQNGQPASIQLDPQSGTSFTRDPKGDTVKLAGTNGIKVRIFSTDAHTAYSGSQDIKTGFTGLLEVRLIGDFEGYVTWALGLSKPACYRTSILTNPTRLVIDIQTS